MLKGIYWVQESIDFKAPAPGLVSGSSLSSREWLLPPGVALNCSSLLRTPLRKPPLLRDGLSRSPFLILHSSCWISPAAMREAASPEAGVCGALTSASPAPRAGRQQDDQTCEWVSEGRCTCSLLLWHTEIGYGRGDMFLCFVTVLHGHICYPFLGVQTFLQDK